MSSKAERFGPVFLISGIGFFCISLFGMGLSAWMMVKDLPPDPKVQEAMSTKDPELKAQLVSEARGRKLFMSYGCLHCHTQFVRPINDEPLRYGPPSQAQEYAYEIPHLFGTRRLGPDLAREGGKRTDDWQFAHLYNPRYTVPESNMPGFPWLFEKNGEDFIPNQDAKDIVAYMQSLGRAKKEKLVRGHGEEYASANLANIGLPQDEELKHILFKRGETLYQRECRGCHGETGNGRGPGAAFLTPKVQNLRGSQWNPAYVLQVMTTGVAGTSMPSFRDMPYDNMRAISVFVASREQYDDEAAWPPSFNREALLEKGKTLYDAQCQFCHGEKGGGDGAAGIALKPKPAKFSHQRPNVDQVLQALNEGVPGTAMAPYGALSEEDKYALAAHIQSLYTYPVHEKEKD